MKRLLILPLFFVTLPLLAEVTQIQSSPTAFTVPIDRAASLSLTWTVIREQSRATPAGEEIRSAKGEVRLASDGELLGEIPHPLSQRLPVNPDLPQDTVSFHETVLIPAHILRLAARRGASRILYQRRFDDGFGAAEATVILTLSGSTAADFGLSDLALRFTDGWVLAVIAPDTPLHAQARIGFSGTGQLRGRWEVAEPAVAGHPRYRPLAQVRRYLTGGGTATLLSPPLPTTRSGGYLVRFVIEAPTTGFAQPFLRYQVSPAPLTVPPLETITPPPDATLTPRLRFAWRPVPGAHIYQLELLDPDTLGHGRPVAGVVVSSPHTLLPATTRGHLSAGRRYLWRVRALDEHGTLLAESLPLPLETRP